jgi:hypothetical protein
MSEQPQDAATKRPLTTLNVPPELHERLQTRWHKYCVDHKINISFGKWHSRMSELQIVDCDILPAIADE